MEITAKELRFHFGKVVKRLLRGEEVTVTYRGKPLAVIRPIRGEVVKGRGFSAVGFGMWRDREQMEDVERWVRERRRPRPL